MENYNWYNVFNLDAFNALGLVSKEYEVVLEEVGLKTILVTKGNLVSMVYEGIMLSLDLNSNNPFYFEGHAIYVNDFSEVFLGIEIEE